MATDPADRVSDVSGQEIGQINRKNGMKHVFQQFNSPPFRYMALALVCVLLFSVFFAARLITDDISTVLDPQAWGFPLRP